MPLSLLVLPLNCNIYSNGFSEKCQPSILFFSRWNFCVEFHQFLGKSRVNVINF